ncbi:DUF1783-domain-containing protein [Xylona heveae TC161]|uniref:DUF1783-domain-containing protein n=1 Tax=Xylona heveae (strain CBS 132557 / TC161) TaxID=1328760 RepID=A0A165IX84_XYLHT|nr:DUF1783-domain-containing protein [Xylona heveae TC161]KZF25500.1 DUF1783-domain-containing protein [Xylona heveae TC161]
MPFRPLRPRLGVPRATGLRTLIAAPKPGSGPLMERRADRELPSIPNPRRWIYTLPIFAVITGVATLCIFNYQKSSSSVVNSTLYALRTHPEARELLGSDIYFANRIPWIWGEINQLHGRINIHYAVKGTKSTGHMRFQSYRKTRMGYFETTEWSLTMPDGRRVELLESAGHDPFREEASN